MGFLENNVFILFIVLFNANINKCDTSGERVNNTSRNVTNLGGNHSLLREAHPLPKQEALTFLRPTVVRGPSRTLIPTRKEYPTARRRTGTQSDRDFLNAFLPQRPKLPRDSMNRRKDSYRQYSRPPSIPFIRNQPRSKKTRYPPPQRPRSSPIDRIDFFDNLDDSEDELFVKKFNEYSITSPSEEFVRNSSMKNSLQGSLEAALRSLWLYR